MLKIYKIFVFSFISCLATSTAFAQEGGDTTITSVDVDLVNLFTQKVPKKYKIAGITVTGNKFFDETLLLSIANLNVGDEVQIPGGDNFAKAITKLWGQNYFSDVQLYVTKLEAKNIWIEINVTERPRLSKYDFVGVKKGEKEDLMGKTGLVPNRIVTENMKRSAKEAIVKFYAEKSYKNIKVNIQEKRDTAFGDAVSLTFIVDKGPKVKINNLDFVGNTIEGLKLKKQMKDTKEMSRLTLRKTDDKSAFGTGKIYNFNEYIRENGYLSFTKTKKVLDPFVRIKLFASAKFNEKKFEEDKEKLLEFYNSQGFRDAAIQEKCPTKKAT